MPSEAKILREKGPEGLRAFWRERSREQRRRRGMPERPTTCMDCRTPISQPRRGMRLRCAGCNAEQDRIRSRKAPSHSTVQCIRCGEKIDGGRYNQKQYCPDCRVIRDRELRREGAQRHPRHQIYCRIGDARQVRYASCLFCRSLLMLHGHRTRCDTNRCRQLQERVESREYQRRTRATAIRYWRIAPTPQALEVARMYFELRQAVRGRTDVERYQAQ